MMISDSQGLKEKLKKTLWKDVKKEKVTKSSENDPPPQQKRGKWENWENV